MTVIATASNPRFSVSRVDIDRAGPTYTRDTLRDLHALNPDSELYFITGADALASILSWQGWEELFDLARFVGVSRPGYDLRREHTKQRRPLWYLMPDGVVQYVKKRRLYRRPEDTARPTESRLAAGNNT